MLAAEAGSSAAQVSADVVLGDYEQREHVMDVVRDSDAVTFDHEHVPNEFLNELIERGVNVQPQPSALINAQDKLVMRKRLREAGAPVPPFMGIESVQDMEGFWESTGGAVCVKARRGGYDGKGVWFPADRDEALDLTSRLLHNGVPVMAEKKVDLVRELSAMVARTPSGEVIAWPVVESVQEQGICVEAIAPAVFSSEQIVEHAHQLCQDIAVELGVTGVLAVELFEVEDANGQPELFINELAMRPHNTGHWTQNGCVTDQFEQHLRAVLDRPLGSTALTAPATVMANVLGGEEDPEKSMHERMDDVWRRFPGAKIHMYGKQWRPRRKIGHVNLSLTCGSCADEDAVKQLRREARLAAQYLVSARWEDGWSPR